MAHKRETGSLYVVATPIGNLGDITLRALEIFKEVDLVLCESAKETRSLFSKLEITTPVLALYKDSSETPFANVLDQLKAGKSMALVSDAGTPGVSDPGSQMVRIAREKGFGSSRFQVLPLSRLFCLFLDFRSIPHIFWVSCLKNRVKNAEN